MIEIDKLSFSYPKRKEKILDNISVSIPSGFNVILGPNGAGKSTLTKCLFNILSYEGDIVFLGHNIRNMPLENLMDKISYLPQIDGRASNLTVFEIVLLGLLPTLGQRVLLQHKQAVIDSLELLGIAQLASKQIHQLSGGQQKLVYIAQTVVRKPELIVLDEPTNSLDLQKQLELFEILQTLIKEKGLSVIVVIHDLTLVARYADYAVVLTGSGSLYAAGEIASLFTPKMFLDVYGVNVSVVLDEDRRPVLSFHGSVRTNHQILHLDPRCLAYSPV